MTIYLEELKNSMVGSKFKPAYSDGQTTLDQFMKLYVCPWCGKVYTNPSSLSLHKGRCEKVPEEVREQWRIEATISQIKTKLKMMKLLSEEIKWLQEQIRNEEQELQKEELQKQIYIS